MFLACQGVTSERAALEDKVSHLKRLVAAQRGDAEEDEEEDEDEDEDEDENVLGLLASPLAVVPLPLFGDGGVGNANEDEGEADGKGVGKIEAPVEVSMKAEGRKLRALRKRGPPRKGPATADATDAAAAAAATKAAALAKWRVGLGYSEDDAGLDPDAVAARRAARDDAACRCVPPRALFIVWLVGV